MFQRNPSPERRGLHDLGLILTVAGICLFLLALVGFISRPGDLSEFWSRSRSPLLTAIGGLVCAGLGRLLTRPGRPGPARSGLKPDPEEAHHNLEPSSRRSRAIFKETLDETDRGNPRRSPGRPFDEPLRRLEALKRDGLITRAEYAAAKAGILNRLGR